MSCTVDLVEAEVYNAYASRDFNTAIKGLDYLVSVQPGDPRWREFRGAVLIDAKRFTEGLADYNAALELVRDLAGPAQAQADATGKVNGRDAPAELVREKFGSTEARLLSGRALAYEGLGEWKAALDDYNAALEVAGRAGLRPDPFVVNSRGNVNASLERWQDARDDYLASARGFQMAKGFRSPTGSTTQRLDGAIFASSNAALMLAQLGDEAGATKEMERIARRAPGSSDMKIALSALYWSQGREQEAEDLWRFACEEIVVGCEQYRDKRWLREVRRWPPRMVERMSDFLSIRGPKPGSGAASGAGA
ncbi:unnamed protein product [Pedinophyceae sp. YPF-701]|nr:unnamed protein product [Pedinophyceae sp. YPF-701]